MRRAVVVAVFVLACAAAQAEELWVIKDGVLNKEALTPEATKSTDEVYLCEGETVDGLYVTGPNFKGRPNWSRFNTAKSAVGDCEFKVVFSAASGRQKWRFPAIQISDRGSLCFWKTGSPIILSTGKVSLPLEGFDTEISPNPFDGQLHSMAVKRVGDKISFYYDDKQLNEQPVDPDVRLHIWFDALFATCKIKSLKLTAEEFSDNLKSEYESAAPIEDIYKGSGAHEKPVYGEACRYRIPALAVSKMGTILAFAEARRTGGADVGDIDAVVKRSEDGGKTWGPEITIIDAGEKSVNNQCPIVDQGRGRIWLCAVVIADPAPRQILVSYSDDDGRNWSEPRNVTAGLHDPDPGAAFCGPGPGAGIVLERGKHAGRLVVPMNFDFRGMCVSGAVYSDDRGRTWKTGGMLRAGALMTEARCVELLDGSLLFNARTIEGKRAHCIVPEGGSKDTTKRWLQADLVDPNCQGAIFRYSWPKDGKPGLILYSGPAGPARSHGTLFGSYDDGKTWPWKRQYYEGGSGYSDACVLPDGRIAILFEKDGKANLGFMIVPAPPAKP